MKERRKIVEKSVGVEIKGRKHERKEKRKVGTDEKEEERGQ